jgi:hypothetical protein
MDETIYYLLGGKDAHELLPATWPKSARVQSKQFWCQVLGFGTLFHLVLVLEVAFEVLNLKQSQRPAAKPGCRILPMKSCITLQRRRGQGPHGATSED